MEQRSFATAQGSIVYWRNTLPPQGPTLIFLPGLTADHRLFDSQIEQFEQQYPLLVWDAPGHAASRPFDLNFSLADKAGWLHDILQEEKIERPVLIGQSMGGYVAQAFCQYFPGEAAGLISIDSAPLQLEYMTAAELYLLRHTEPMYRLYPWKLLVSSGARGCAESGSGRRLMTEIMREYDGEKDYYCRLVSQGFRMLAEAIQLDLPYQIDCPTLLICGEKDKAGSARRYNRVWQQKTGLPLVWIKNAGHNANTDAPQQINTLIEDFLSDLP